MGFYSVIMSLECLSGVFVFVVFNDIYKKVNEKMKEKECYCVLKLW